MNIFLDDKIPDLDMSERSAMGNWLALAELIFGATSTPAMLKSMIKHELTTKRRKHIIERLVTRYNSLRNKQVKTEVIECLENLKRKPKPT